MELIAQRKIDYKVWWQFVSRYISIYFSQSIFITVLYHALPTYSSEI
jgi:succinate dehydrogenase hydrophobic anchor subunit